MDMDQDLAVFSWKTAEFQGLRTPTSPHLKFSKFQGIMGIQAGVVPQEIGPY